MSRALIVYGTGEGHSDDVAEALVKHLRAAGVTVDAVRIQDAPPNADGVDAVIVGSSIHVSKHDKHVVAWIEANKQWLTEHPSAFFQVSLASATDAPESQTKAGSYIDDLITTTGWHPDLVGLFGGALLYTRYGFAKRALLKSIAKKSGLGSDTQRDYDYTDYEAVKHFADDVAAMIAEQK